LIIDFFAGDSTFGGEIAKGKCCKPNLGLATKARVCEGVGQE